MKKLILTLLLFVPLFISAQKVVETVKLSNGKSIVVYDDYSWKYRTETITKSVTNTTNAKQPLVSQPKTTTKTTSNVKPKPTSTSTYKSTSTSSYCGARTKSGGYCKRKVAGGGRCWQH